MRRTVAILNGKDKKPTQAELESMWFMMEASAEDGWLSPDHIGNVEQEVDEDDLRKLLRSNMSEAKETFGYFTLTSGSKTTEINFPEYMCGYYLQKRGAYMFIQWGATS